MYKYTSKYSKASYMFEMWLRCLIYLFCFFAVSLSNPVSYDGFKVYRVQCKNRAEMTILRAMEGLQKYDFWTKNRLGDVALDISVGPAEQAEFETILTILNIDYSVLIDDLEEVIQREKQQIEASKARNVEGKLSYDAYHRYEEIMEYIANVSALHKNITELQTYGASYESRPLKLLKISSGGSDKPIIFIDGGVHAREWISPAVALYIIDQLVKTPALIEKVDWYIAPLINPDGYEYSQTKDRMWRKTRSKGPTTNCFGADMNRNFGYHWNEGGASSDECSITYCGDRPYSEVESAALRDVLAAHHERIKLYIALHSYGQYVLYPYGYTATPAENKAELHAAGKAAADAIFAVNGSKYTVGSTHEVLYTNSGSSRDWCRGELQIPLAYTIELPGGGSAGFDLPPSQIQRVVVETFEGIKAFGKFVEDSYA